MFTGSNQGGAEHATAPLGANDVEQGRLDDPTGSPLGGGGTAVSSSADHFYALSQVLEVVNPVPGKPEIQKVNAAVGATTASFYWINPAPNLGTEILFFRVERRKDDVDAWTLAGVGRSDFALFEDTGLDPETT